jgi:hypothetical protein
VIDAIRIHANVSNKMRGYRRNRSMLPYTNSIAYRATAFERAALLQAFQVGSQALSRTPATSSCMSKMYSAIRISQNPVRARPEASAFYNQLRQGQI